MILTPAVILSKNIKMILAAELIHPTGLLRNLLSQVNSGSQTSRKTKLVVLTCRKSRQPGAIAP